jgi:hypothetical protein
MGFAFLVGFSHETSPERSIEGDFVVYLVVLSGPDGGLLLLIICEHMLSYEGNDY